MNLKNRPICFGTFLTSMEKLRKGEYWKCNCPECPFRMECQIKESEVTNLTLVTNRILTNQKVIMNVLVKLTLDDSVPVKTEIEEAQECTDIILKKIRDDYEPNQNQKES